jgi:hypothetical protein
MPRRDTLLDLPTIPDPAPDPYVSAHLRYQARRDDRTETRICRPAPEAWRLLTTREET